MSESTPDDADRTRGLAIRFVRAYDAVVDTTPSRVDLRYVGGVPVWTVVHGRRDRVQPSIEDPMTKE